MVKEYDGENRLKELMTSSLESVDEKKLLEVQPTEVGVVITEILIIPEERGEEEEEDKEDKEGREEIVA